MKHFEFLISKIEPSVLRFNDMKREEFDSATNIIPIMGADIVEAYEDLVKASDAPHFFEKTFFTYIKRPISTQMAFFIALDMIESVFNKSKKTEMGPMLVTVIKTGCMSPHLLSCALFHAYKLDDVKEIQEISSIFEEVGEPLWTAEEAAYYHDVSHRVRESLNHFSLEAKNADINLN